MLGYIERQLGSRLAVTQAIGLVTEQGPQHEATLLLLFAFVSGNPDLASKGYEYN
jgi:hypothetical protein